MKAILIAGVTSGSGKTSVTLGVMSALAKQYRIQPYKVGPDYVDPKFHTRIVGRQSRNLDSFLTPDPATLQYLFSQQTADIDLGIVEGVMGLYDGLGVDKDSHSTASLAKALGLPVILVVDGHATSTSAAAIIKGFQDFDPDVRIAGVIVNNLRSDHHFDLIKTAIETYDQLPVLGYLPHDEMIALPSRQLGLVPDDELPKVDQKIQRLGQLIDDHVDLDQLVSLAAPVQPGRPLPFSIPHVRLTLGIARDEAFNFYYSDNLALLKRAGVMIKFFSPLYDAALPEHVDALYFGGGYPEEFAAQLEANQSMRQAVKHFSEANRPIYAECGGLMYLGRSLRKADHDYQMVGVFSGRSEMTPRLRRFGYCLASPIQETILGHQGAVIRGHEFHHSTYQAQNDQELPVLAMKKVVDGQVVSQWQGGFQIRNTFASYLHVHFYQDATLFTQFLRQMGGVIRATD